MSEKRRGLGRGLGALIPTGPATTGSRPVDVFFPAGDGDTEVEGPREAPVSRREPALKSGKQGKASGSTPSGVGSAGAETPAHAATV